MKEKQYIVNEIILKELIGGSHPLWQYKQIRESPVLQVAIDKAIKQMIKKKIIKVLPDGSCR